MNSNMMFQHERDAWRRIEEAEEKEKMDRYWRSVSAMPRSGPDWGDETAERSVSDAVSKP